MTPSEDMRPQDPRTEPDHVLWRAVVAALAGREEAARQLHTDLAPPRRSSSKQPAVRSCRPAARDVLERILPVGT